MLVVSERLMSLVKVIWMFLSLQVNLVSEVRKQLYVNLIVVLRNRVGSILMSLMVSVFSNVFLCVFLRFFRERCMLKELEEEMLVLLILSFIYMLVSENDLFDFFVGIGVGLGGGSIILLFWNLN